MTEYIGPCRLCRFLGSPAYYLGYCLDCDNAYHQKFEPLPELANALKLGEQVYGVWRRER